MSKLSLKNNAENGKVPFLDLRLAVLFQTKKTLDLFGGMQYNIWVVLENIIIM